MGERVFLGLGSNLGDRAALIARALDLLKDDTTKVVRASRLYVTEPVGGPPGQPDFLNAVAEVETALGPAELHARSKAVEDELGRVRAERWGARTIDIDLLLWGARVVSGGGLAIPHPSMHERMFVLAPLAEIAPDVRHPILGRTAREMLAALAESGENLPEVYA